jgi:hypothetical protein
MKNSNPMRKLRRLVVCWAVFCFLVTLPFLSSARTVTTSVNIVNNSNRTIRSVYLSHVDQDDWTGNQLSESTSIASGQSYALSNVACDQQQVKVIGENADGCFLTRVINCGDNATWTITNDTEADCGAN